MFKIKEWHLTRGGEILAIIRIDGKQIFSEYPCAEGVFTTTPAFEQVKHLLKREAKLLEIDKEPENSEWLDIWGLLKKTGLFVETIDGSTKIEILWIHFKDGRAWWYPLIRSPNTILPTSAKDAKKRRRKTN